MVNLLKIVPNWTKLIKMAGNGPNWSFQAKMMKDAQKWSKYPSTLVEMVQNDRKILNGCKIRKNLCLQDLRKFDQSDQDLPTPIYLISGRIECKKNQKH